jgi:surfeit locus 1 family protein
LTKAKIAALVAFDVAALLFVAFLVSLTIWQLHRRDWKLDLIARVEARIHATPVPAPAADKWARVSAATDEYRRVTASGRWLEDRSALVHAATDFGQGYWLMTPLRQADGTAILVNRGFVPTDKRAESSWQARGEDAITVTGLLRISEPRGGFLRDNDPATNRWYSRDVAAIAASRGLQMTAPYFIDAERTASDRALPIAGLTVVSFSNNHLLYAVIWGILAVMAAAGAVFVNVDWLRRTGGRPDRTASTEALP